VVDGNSGKCNVCGYLNDVSANFCSSCGAAIIKQTDATLMLSPEIFFEDISEPNSDLSSIAGAHELSPVLVIKQGPDSGMTYILDQDETTIGRNTESDIFLDDITVSRNHARVIRSVNDSGGYAYQLKDAGSLNGTYVNKKRIEAMELVGGEEVQVGKFKLLYIAPRSH